MSRLPGGLRVATLEMPHMSSVSLGVWVGVGSRYETPKLNGACHFIEHLLFKGTSKRSARDISEAVEGVGGYLNAFTSEESTCFHARVSAERFDEVLDVLLDMVLNSRFAPGDVRKEREVIKEEIAMSMDEPQHLVQEVLNATLWPGHPLGRPITGTARSLNGLGRQELLSCLKHHYLAANTVIAVAGRVRHAQVVKRVKPSARHFGQSAPPGFAPAIPDQSAPRFKLVTRDTEQTQLAIGLRGCSRHDDRRFALRLLNALLGENMSSRLFQAVREDHGLAYSIYSTPSFFADAGDLVISAGLDADNLPRTLRLIGRELRRISAQPPTAVELRRARDYAVGQISLGQENTETQMNWLGEQMLGYGRVLGVEQLKQRLCAVRAAEIRDVARDFFRPDRLNVALVSPLKQAKFLANCLRL